MSFKYFISKNNKKEGPLSIEELKKLDIKAEDLIWRSDKEDWIEAQKLDELNDVVFVIPLTPSEKKNVAVKSQLTSNFWIIIAGYVVGSILLGLISSSVAQNKYLEYINGIEPIRKNQSNSYVDHDQIYILKGDYYYSRYPTFAPHRDNETYFYNKTNTIALKPFKAFYTEIYLSKAEQNSPPKFMLNMIVASFINLFFVSIVLYLLYAGYLYFFKD